MRLELAGGSVVELVGCLAGCIILACECDRCPIPGLCVEPGGVGHSEQDQGLSRPHLRSEWLTCSCMYNGRICCVGRIALRWAPFLAGLSRGSSMTSFSWVGLLSTRRHCVHSSGFIHLHQFTEGIRSSLVAMLHLSSCRRHPAGCVESQ